jgi:hypothetical protein
VKSSTTIPIVIPLKRKFPSTAKMKYTSIRRENTLKSDGRENVIV